MNIDFGEIGRRLRIWERKEKANHVYRRVIYILRNREINHSPRTKARAIDNSAIINIMNLFLFPVIHLFRHPCPHIPALFATGSKTHILKKRTSTIFGLICFCFDFPATEHNVLFFRFCLKYF